ncbi:MAG: hypothetical protein ACOYK6_02770 [Chthoniobacterales bacterium]
MKIPNGIVGILDFKNKSRCYLLISIFVLFTGIAFSTESTATSQTSSKASSFFSHQEWSASAGVLSMLGTIRGMDSKSIGPVCGISCYFSKYIGLGVMDSVLAAQANHKPGQCVDMLQSVLLARYPITLDGFRICPCVMLGGGAMWMATSSQGYGSIGFGLEHPITETIGVYANCGWIYGSSSGNALSMAMPSVGVNFKL